MTYSRIAKQRNTIILVITLLLVSIGMNIFQHWAIVTLLDVENSREVTISQEILKVISECKL